MTIFTYVPTYLNICIYLSYFDFNLERSYKEAKVY